MSEIQRKAEEYSKSMWGHMYEQEIEDTLHTLGSSSEQDFVNGYNQALKDIKQFIKEATELK